jgi:predicted branched-subunit amino acid permease
LALDIHACLGFRFPFIVVTIIGFVRHGAHFLTLFVPSGVPAPLLAILVPIWRGRGDLAPWAASGLAALAASGLGLGAPWPVLVGAFTGAGLGAWQDMRREARA